MARETIEYFFRIIVEMSHLDGITLKDYYFLIEMLKYLSKEDYLYIEILDFIALVKKKIFLYSKEEIAFVKDNTALLPLILANIESSYYINSKHYYVFPSQFKSGSNMSLNDFQNRLHCFGTNQNYDVISYLERVENLSFKETINLLTSIFLLTSEPSEKKHLIYKYQAVLLSPEYTLALSRKMNKIYRDKEYSESKAIEEFYQNRFNTIMRVRRKEIDSNFQNKRENKKIQIP